MYKPYGNRCLVKIGKHFIYDENKKPVLNDERVHVYEPEQEGKVLSSNIPDIKKGMTIIPIIRGGVPIRAMEDKKSVVISLDFEDIYAVKI
jgi:hypothetical protein